MQNYFSRIHLDVVWRSKSSYSSWFAGALVDPVSRFKNFCHSHRDPTKNMASQGTASQGTTDPTLSDTTVDKSCDDTPVVWAPNPVEGDKVEKEDGVFPFSGVSPNAGKEVTEIIFLRMALKGRVARVVGRVPSGRS